MTTPTEARALADRLAPFSTGGMWEGAIPPSAKLKDEAVSALRSLADQVDRQAGALKILDGFKGPPPTKYQWEGICALVQDIRATLAREAT